MKKFFLFFGFFFHSIFSFGQLSFEWFNKEKGLLERINFQSGNYETLKVNKDNTFKVQGKLRIDGVNLADIKPNFDVNVFPKGKNRILTVPGTGQVYELDLNLNLFKRLDKTFYRGYNFKALQFVQNDTLYSLGGTGFWQYHNVLSFFDPSSAEWQVMYPKGVKPEGIYSYSSGISDGKVFAVEKQRDLDLKDPDRNAQIFEFDIKSKIWTKVGELNSSLLSEIGINTTEFQYSSYHLFFLHTQEPIYADFKTNEVFKYNESRRSFLTNKGSIYISKGWVYTYLNEHNKFKIDSIPYSELKKNSIFLGTLYTISTPKTNNYVIGGLGLVVLLGSILIFKLILKSKSKIQLKPSSSAPKYLNKFLEVYKQNGSDYLISTEELSRIIECDLMAFDTQRQYRSKFISAVNSYALENFNITEAIFRSNHESDKRFIQYGIKNEFFDLIEVVIA